MFPSIVLTIEAFPEIHALHIIPETCDVELINDAKAPHFCYGGAKERSREQLGAVVILRPTGDSLRGFLDDISQQVQKHLGTGKEHHLDDINQVLRSAALSRIQQSTGQEPDTATTQSYPVFIVHIDRAKSGKIVAEPRSISNW